jgi:ribosomal 50S subunit-associated protein YjgA (DUF615 family)
MKHKLYPTDAPPVEDPAPRGDVRRERMRYEEALLELAERLTRLDPLDFAPLGLPEEVGDAVADARACKPGKPRNRAFRNVRATLRDLDPDVVTRVRQRLAQV